MCGGGSEINSGLYHRPPAEVLEAWRSSHDLQSTREEDLRPHYEANERELQVSYLPGPAPAASLLLHEGANRLGWKSIEVPRWFAYKSSGPGVLPTGTKQSMTQTFIPRALRAGGALLPQTRALRIGRRNGGWRVSAEFAGPPRRHVEIRAKRVFLACGPLQSAALLQRSGLGRNVGQTLRVHPTIKVVARFPFEVNRPGMGVPVHQVKEFAPRFSFGCSISSLPYLAIGLIEHPDTLASLPQTWTNMAVYYAMTGGGTGSVRPLPLFRDPLVRFCLSDADRAELGTALRELCRCLLAAGAEALYPSIAGMSPVTTESQVRAIGPVPEGRTSLMTIHLFSTNPMGENRARCAVDSLGRVHGEKDLWVADASLLPGPPGVNPQGTLMAIARRNVLHFLGRI